MKCPICQTEMKKGCCPSCGYAEVHAPTPEFCAEDARFGTDNYRADSANDPYYTPPRKSPAKAALIVLGLLLTAVIALVLLLSVSVLSGTTSSPEIPVSLSQESIALPGGVTTVEDGVVVQDSTTLLPLASFLAHSDFEPTVLYDENGLSVELVGLSNGIAYDESGALDLYIKNDSGATCTVSVDSIVLNGISFSCYLYEEIDDGIWMHAQASFSLDAPLQLGISHIDTASLLLRCTTTQAETLQFTEPVRARDDTGAAVSVPTGTTVYEADGLRLIYCGASDDYDWDGNLEPKFWFFAQNDGTDDLQIYTTEISIGKQSEDYPSGTTVLPAGQSCFFSVQPSDYAMHLNAQSVTELNRVQLVWSIDNLANYEPIITDYTVTLDLS